MTLPCNHFHLHGPSIPPSSFDLAYNFSHLAITTRISPLEDGRPCLKSQRTQIVTLKNLIWGAFTSLTDALINNKSLMKLDLSCNPDVTGWQALSSILRRHSVLEDLNLSGNGISDEVANSIANSLVSNTNTKLKKLNLELTGLIRPTASLSVLRSPHSVLESLNLEYNGIDDDT